MGLKTYADRHSRSKSSILFYYVWLNFHVFVIKTKTNVEVYSESYPHTINGNFVWKWVRLLYLYYCLNNLFFTCNLDRYRLLKLVSFLLVMPSIVLSLHPENKNLIAAEWNLFISKTILREMENLMEVETLWTLEGRRTNRN